MTCRASISSNGGDGGCMLEERKNSTWKMFQLRKEPHFQTTLSVFPKANKEREEGLAMCYFMKYTQKKNILN
jgi:hypothetical protein